MLSTELLSLSGEKSDDLWEKAVATEPEKLSEWALQSVLCHLSNRFSHGLTFPESIKSITFRPVQTPLPITHSCYHFHIHLITTWHISLDSHTPINNPDSFIHTAKSQTEVIHQYTKPFLFIFLSFLFVCSEFLRVFLFLYCTKRRKIKPESCEPWFFLGQAGA